MQLFYAPDITLPLYTLGEEESKHCVRVLRLGEGDQLHLTDGRGNMHLCEVVDAHPKRCSVKIVSTEYEFEKMNYRLVMAVAPTKNIERFEWFLEKATEIGVSEFIPLETAHSERRTIKLEREQRVITSAVKQSLKAYHPELHDMTEFRKLLDMPFEGRRFIAHCGNVVKGKSYLAKSISAGENVMILIGPEGDFSPEEVAVAVECGFEEITLGHQRLRTETAAVVAVTMVATVNG
ncbi:MAG: 16S rRNA (uracil(1498)-N(3))-methyltransferase [Alistipes sp.]|nr:16S rRNA (uracil(1498)-N(3))-methyltransferase [Alistipes sp.]